MNKGLTGVYSSETILADQIRSDQIRSDQIRSEQSRSELTASFLRLQKQNIIFMMDNRRN